MKGCFRQGGINMIGTIHKEIVVDGKRYNFKIVSEVFGDEVEFYIRAICKFTKRTSCINNLNAVLSELIGDNETDNPKYYDSSWTVTKKEAKKFMRIANNFLNCDRFMMYLEKKLDDDREEGEWENIVTERGEIKEYEEKE